MSWHLQRLGASSPTQGQPPFFAPPDSNQPEQLEAFANALRQQSTADEDIAAIFDLLALGCDNRADGIRRAAGHDTPSTSTPDSSARS